MSTHNICFYGEIKKNYPRIIAKYSFLTIPLKVLVLNTTIYFHGEIRKILCEHFLFTGDLQSTVLTVNIGTSNFLATLVFLSEKSHLTTCQSVSMWLDEWQTAFPLSDICFGI